MSIITDDEARQWLQTKIAAASGSQRVYRYNLLDLKLDKDGNPDFSEWPAQFTYGTNGETVHGWVIGRSARMGELRDSCEDPDFHYFVYGFYKFRHDGATTDAANSEKEFSEKVDAVAASINQGEDNGIIEISGKTAYHEGIQFPVLTLLRAGQERLHFAGGEIHIFQTT